MNSKIMTREKSTNIFKKIWDWDGTHIIIVLLVAVGIFTSMVKILNHLEEKSYPYGNYEMTYRVYYTPTTYKDYTITHDRPINVGSSKGSNYVKKYNGERVIETSAPIEIIRYVKKN